MPLFVYRDELKQCRSKISELESEWDQTREELFAKEGDGKQ